MAGAVSLAIRTLHVLTMAVLVGGSVLVWFQYRSGATADLTLARAYEWVFWTGFGILAVTGVGNLGALDAPGPATAWGRTLLVKLVVVLAFVLGSAVRTQAVVRATGTDTEVSTNTDPGKDTEVNADTDPGPDAGMPTAGTTLTRAYGATAGALLGLVVLAEVLAHG